jgi:hypothetical protein
MPCRKAVGAHEYLGAGVGRRRRGRAKDLSCADPSKDRQFCSLPSRPARGYGGQKQRGASTPAPVFCRDFVDRGALA